MTSPIYIQNLAVLRASVEGVHLGAYFGSWGALNNWIASTRLLGWIDAGGKPTESGVALAQVLCLKDQGEGRAYMWRDAAALESRARALSDNKETYSVTS